MQQCAFANTVLAQHTPEFAWTDLPVELHRQGHRTGAQSQFFGSEQGRSHRHHARLRVSNHKNSGTPIKAVMTPTGNCVGAATVRAARSASARPLPPANAAAGNNMR